MSCLGKAALACLKPRQSDCCGIQLLVTGFKTPGPSLLLSSARPPEATLLGRPLLCQPGSCSSCHDMPDASKRRCIKMMMRGLVCMLLHPAKSGLQPAKGAMLSEDAVLQNAARLYVASLQTLLQQLYEHHAEGWAAICCLCLSCQSHGCPHPSVS